MSMRIGVEACTWSNRRGYGRFVRELLTQMIEDFPEHEFVLVVDEHSAKDCDFPDAATVEVVETSAQPTEAASAAGSRSPADLYRMARAVGRAAHDHKQRRAVSERCPQACRDQPRLRPIAPY